MHNDLHKELENIKESIMNMADKWYLQGVIDILEIIKMRVSKFDTITVNDIIKICDQYINTMKQ